jgi:hypothetical protein
MLKKRQQNMGQMLKIRKYQFICLTMAGVFYMMVYRKYLHPKSIMNSVLYHNSLKYVKGNSTIAAALGDNIHMMNCNGKAYPLLSNCKFDLIVFGSKAKGKVHVEAEYSKDINQYEIKLVKLQTENEKV